MTAFAITSERLHSPSEGGFLEAVKTTIHCAQTTPGASQFYLAIPLIGLSRLAGGGKKLTAAAVTVGTILGTLFSNWKEVSAAYQKGSGLTGTGVVTEGISFAGQTALMIASGFVGGPTGKLTSLLASHLVRRINYLRLPLISGGMERLTRVAIQLFVSGSGVYGFAVATHATTTGINRSLGQENAFHDFWGQVNHLFFFMGTQQLVGLAGIGKGATSIASKALRWSANTVAASIAMQTVVNPIVFGKPISSSLHDLVTNIGNESRDLALLHMGGKVLPHQLPVLRDSMKKMEREIAENLQSSSLKIHEARLINEQRWQEDPVYRHHLQMGGIAAGVALSIATGSATGVMGLLPCSTLSVGKVVRWPRRLDPETAWKIYQEIYVPSEPGEVLLPKEVFQARFCLPEFRSRFFRDLGGFGVQTVLAVVWNGPKLLENYDRFFGLITSDPRLEQACWDYIQNKIPLWRELNLHPEKYFVESLRATRELARLREEATEDVVTPDLLKLDHLMMIQRMALMLASRDVVIEQTREMGPTEGSLTDTIQAVDGTLSNFLSYNLLKRIDLDTSRYLQPQTYHDEILSAPFQEAYASLHQILLRVYPSEPGDMAIMPRVATEIMEKVKIGGGRAYDEVAAEETPDHLFKSLHRTSPYQLSTLYLYLLTEFPAEEIARERLQGTLQRELDDYRKDRRAKNPELKPDLIDALAIAEYIGELVLHPRYRLERGQVTDLERLKIASLSWGLMPLVREFGRALDPIWSATTSMATWKSYVARNVDATTIRDKMLHPILWAKQFIDQKRKGTDADSIEQSRSGHIISSLDIVYEEIRDVTGLGSIVN